MKIRIIVIVLLVYLLILGVIAAFATDYADLSFFGKIYALVANMTKMFFNPIKWGLDGGVWALQGFFKYCFKGVLEVAKGAIMAISLGDLAVNTAASWGYLNPNVAYLVVASGIPEGLSILAIAYGIRLALNLIPAAFTRI